jgi:hypothetical protein
VSRADDAEAAVREIFRDIDEGMHRNPRIPHGFTLQSVEARMVPAYFPEGAEAVEVRIRLELPVIYTYRNGRAVLPARRDNLEGLRERFEEMVRDRAPQLRTTRWTVCPNSDPEPKTGPDTPWTVEIEMRES